MHPTQFDAIAQALIGATTRRRTLGGLLAGSLALLGVDIHSLATPKTGCSERCGVCRRCKRGRCRETPRGTRCTRGRCRPKRNGRRCGEDRICLDGACRLRCGAGGPCHVFVTSSSHSGNLGGLAGADAICQHLAESVELPGIYKAWLADPENWPASTFLNTERTGPYVLMNGTVIATDWVDLTNDTLGAPIDITERGKRVERSYVWTNVLPDGTAGGNPFGNVHCEQWTNGAATAGETGNIGNSGFRTFSWTTAGASFCDGTLGDTPHRLYCFQQG